MVKSHSLHGNARFEGFSIDMLEHLSIDLGFTYELYLVNDSAFGEKQENGYWNGVVGDILAGVSHEHYDINFIYYSMIPSKTGFLQIPLE